MNYIESFIYETIDSVRKFFNSFFDMTLRPRKFISSLNKQQPIYINELIFLGICIFFTNVFLIEPFFNNTPFLIKSFENTISNHFYQKVIFSIPTTLLSIYIVKAFYLKKRQDMDALFFRRVLMYYVGSFIFLNMFTYLLLNYSRETSSTNNYNLLLSFIPSFILAIIVCFVLKKGYQSFKKLIIFYLNLLFIPIISIFSYLVILYALKITEVKKYLEVYPDLNYVSDYKTRSMSISDSSITYPITYTYLSSDSIIVKWKAYILNPTAESIIIPTNQRINLYVTPTSDNGSYAKDTAVVFMISQPDSAEIVEIEPNKVGVLYFENEIDKKIINLLKSGSINASIDYLSNGAKQWRGFSIYFGSK